MHVRGRATNIESVYTQSIGGLSAAVNNDVDVEGKCGSTVQNVTVCPGLGLVSF